MLRGRANETTWRKAALSLSACLAVLVALSSVACSPSAAVSGARDDVLTQKATEDGRMQITVLVKYAFSIDGFEQSVEEKFPDIDIVQVGNYTCDMGLAEYEARLEHDDLTDVVMMWPYGIGEEHWSDELLDLSGMDFSSRYNISSLNDLSRDGSLYYLPGPSQVRGIVYNKTLFEENGWVVPEDFDGFVELCKTIEASGMRSLQLGLRNSEVLDTAFTGFGYADCYSKPLDKLWMEQYDAGEKGSFGDQFDSALDTFQTLIDEGVLKETDLDIEYSQREAMLFTRECAMIEDSVLLARMGESATGTTDEFALMPFFNPGDGGDWARLYPVCYIGLSAHLEDAGSEKKHAAVMELMDYISAPEGQEALMLDTGAMYSSLNGVGAPSVPEIDDLQNALSQGRYGVFPALANAQAALREGLAGMVRGDLTKADVIALVDKQNASPSASSVADTVLASATEDFTLAETGGYVCDVLRAKTGSDLALFLDNGKDGRYNGKGISARLYGGEITMQDVLRILPDLKHGDTGEVCTVSMMGGDLLKTLEYAIPVDNDQVGWFYYFSGLKMEYDPTAAAGSRILSISLEDGSEIEADAVYSIAVMENSVPGEYVIESVSLDATVTEVLAEAIESSGTVSPPSDGRFALAG